MTQAKNQSASIAWDRAKLSRFKRMYARAKALPVESFVFDGHEFLVSYAGYLIQYLEGRFGGGW